LSGRGEALEFIGSSLSVDFTMSFFPERSSLSKTSTGADSCQLHQTMRNQTITVYSPEHGERLDGLGRNKFYEVDICPATKR
jgi:hypothetical protein